MRWTSPPTAPLSETNEVANPTTTSVDRGRPAWRPVAIGLAALLTLSACSGGGGGPGVASLENTEQAAGGASSSTTLSQADQEQALLDWVECMRGEGVDIADPTVDADGNLVLGGGPQGAQRSSDDAPADPPDREAIQAATTTCGNPPQTAGGNFSQEDRDAFQQSALLLAECMRDEGITDFPDPDFSNFGPGAGTQNDDADADAPRGPFGDVDLQDPDVQAAFTTCQEQLADEGVDTFPGGRGPGASSTEDRG